MTPEEEAAYALDYGVDRDGLRNDVQTAYDRLVEERSLARAQAMRDRAATAAISAAPPVGGDQSTAAAPWLARNSPGRGWYWVAIAVLVAGGVWVVAAFAVLIGQVDSFPRVPDPGSGVVSLRAGDYVIYYEGRVPEVPTGGVNVRPLSASAVVGSISGYQGGLSYQFGSRTGTAVAVLQIARPGKFLIRATGAQGVPPGHLVFGPSIARWILIAALPASVLGLFGVGGVVTIAILRNRRVKPTRAPMAPA